jgi:response regulator RpfG family c-di-GMP phosphodiesterase
VNAAVAAVNEGQIFRFLTKPCPPATLIAAMTDAAEQHRLITAERVLLEQTLHGSLKAMADILALASPVMFGRALQVRRHATSLCDTLGIANRWPIEIASLFSQLGLITLPAEVVEKLHGGETLTPDEERMVARTPAVTEELLVQIPRLEAVRAILSTYRRSFDAASAPSPASRAAQLLKVAVDFTDVEARHTAPGTALAILRGRESAYDPAILDALDATLHSAGVRHEIRELPLSALRVGMVFAEDVMLTTGTMLVARGYEVTERFVARAANFNRGAVREPLRVILPESTSRPS